MVLVILITPLCGISNSLVCEMYPPSLTLIHFLPISSLMNSIILPCIPMFYSCPSVFSVLNLLYAFSISKNIAAVVSFLLNPSRTFVIIFDIASIVLICFLKPNCLSSLFLSFSRYQTSLLFFWKIF